MSKCIVEALKIVCPLIFCVKLAGRPSLTPEAVPTADGSFMAAQPDVKIFLSFIHYIDSCCICLKMKTMKSFILCMNDTVRGD